MADDTSSSVPSLAYVLPDTKEAVTEAAARGLFAEILTSSSSLPPPRHAPRSTSLQSQNDVQAEYVDHVLSPAEASYLVDQVLGCGKLSFWNNAAAAAVAKNGTKGRSGTVPVEAGADADADEQQKQAAAKAEAAYASARKFRDAETVEVQCPALAQLLWERMTGGGMQGEGSGTLRVVPMSISFPTAEEQAAAAAGEGSPVTHLPTEDADHHAPETEVEADLAGTWHAVGLNSDLLFARYPSRGGFAPHTDGRAVKDFNTRSFFSVIVFLNSIPQHPQPQPLGGGEGADDAVGESGKEEGVKQLETVAGPGGGGTRFYKPEALRLLQQVGSDRGESDGDPGSATTTGAPEASRWSINDPSLLLHEVPPVAGRVLMFHQSLVHEGVPPAAPNLKYIIRSDVMYRRDPAMFDSEQDRAAYSLLQEAEVASERGEVDASIAMFKRAMRLAPGLCEFIGYS